MDISQLTENSLQKISVWSNDARKWVFLDSLFLSVHKHSEADEDCADFLTAQRRHHKAIYRVGEEYNFVIYSSRPDRLEYKEGIWVFSWTCEKDVILPCHNYHGRYKRYREIAKVNKLIQ